MQCCVPIESVKSISCIHKKDSFSFSFNCFQSFLKVSAEWPRISYKLLLIFPNFTDYEFGLTEVGGVNKSHCWVGEGVLSEESVFVNLSVKCSQSQPELKL